MSAFFVVEGVFMSRKSCLETVFCEPIYVSFFMLSFLVTVAWYTTPFVRHLFSTGHSSLSHPLQVLALSSGFGSVLASVDLLCLEMILWTLAYSYSLL